MSASSCTIALGQSTCAVTLSWSTTYYPVTTAQVTSNWPTAKTVIGTGPSGGPVSMTIPFTGRTFYLYQGFYPGQDPWLLNQKTVTASCVAGTVWTRPGKCA